MWSAHIDIYGVVHNSCPIYITCQLISLLMTKDEKYPEKSKGVFPPTDSGGKN